MADAAVPASPFAQTRREPEQRQIAAALGLLQRLAPKVRGIPSWILGQVVFWRPGVPRPRNHNFQGKYSLFGLAAFGGEANKT